MSYFEKIGIYGTDSPSIDAFARLRVSYPYTEFDSKLTLSGSLETYWTNRVWSNATASYSVYESSENLFVGISSGSRVISQTKQHFIYEPGKSLLIVKTGVFGTGVPGIIKYIAYGDDYYGVGFCQSGSSFGIFKRNIIDENTVITTFVSQSNWNLDRFDGTGPSGKTLNVTASQIFFEDLEWLGVGRVRYGIFQGGIPYYVHQFSHINELENVYMGNPNLPIRYELTNMIGSVATGSLKHICSSICSEGGSDTPGIYRTIDTESGSISVGANEHTALLILRQQTGSAATAFRDGITRIFPTGFDILQTANTPVMWELLYNPTIPTSASFNWKQSGKFSAEYATGSITTTISDKGRVIASGYLPASTGQVKAGSTNINIDPFYSLGHDLYGNRDTVVLAAWNLSGTPAVVYASLTFKEIL